jgi:hypothetical protein
MYSKSKIVFAFLFFLMSSTIVFAQGIFSAKAYLLTDEFAGVTRYFSCDTNGACDHGWTSDWEGTTVSTITVGETFQFGGNLITNDDWTNWSDATLYYRIYLEGSVPPVTFTAINLTLSSNNICGISDNAKRETVGTSQLINAPAIEGVYIFEIYFQAKYNLFIPPNDILYYSNLSANYKAKLNVIQPIASFESYAFVSLNGVPTFYDLDGAFGSSNPGLPNFLGTYPPGLAFRLGAEQKIYKKATNHTVCECSSWYYFYEDDPMLDPIDTDFPLPTDGTNFTNGFNGLFKKSAILPSFAGSFDANGTSDSVDYNNLINGSTTIEKYQNTSLGLDAEIIFPNCIGYYRIAIALLTKYSINGNCDDTASLRYFRDINQTPIFKYNNTSDVNLNPKKPVNSLSTNDFYITSIQVYDTNIPIWTGTWSTPPDKGSNVVFQADYQTAMHGDLTVNTVTVEDGVTLTVSNGGHIECYNNAVTNGTGKIVVKNQGNFVQRCGKATIIRPYIEMEKISRPMSDWDYVYWGVPVSENIYNQIPGLLDRRYRWQSGTATGAWQNFGATNPGEGFITRIPNSAPFNTTPTAVNFTMKGTANNGSVFVNVDSFDTSSIIYGNAVLLANPYPCALDAATFLDHPNNTELGGTLSFWTSFTPISDLTPGPDTYNYNEADYATWNRTGGTGTKASTDTTGNDSLRPTGKIASGQGFFVHAFADGQIEFDNSMRLLPNVNTQFFRTTENTSLTEVQEKHRFWLNFNDEHDGFRQMLVGFVPNATNEIDRNFDGSSVTTSSIDLYTLCEDKKLNIQGRALPFDPTIVLPMGFRVEEEGIYTISIDSYDGVFNTHPIFVKDKILDIIHNLKNGPYLFSSAEGIFDARFELVFENDVFLSVNETNQLENDVYIATKETVSLQSMELMESIKIYDLIGRKIYQKADVNLNSISLDDFPKGNQVYVVKIKTTTSLVTKKILF